MHLAYLIYDVGFQSADSQAAQPMVFTITFLLVAIIALLNVAAIWLRSRLRRRYAAQTF
jgi:phosphate transport system permease protein